MLLVFRPHPLSFSMTISQHDVSLPQIVTVPIWALFIAPYFIERGAMVLILDGRGRMPENISKEQREYST